MEWHLPFVSLALSVQNCIRSGFLVRVCAMKCVVAALWDCWRVKVDLVRVTATQIWSYFLNLKNALQDNKKSFETVLREKKYAVLAARVSFPFKMDLWGIVCAKQGMSNRWLNDFMLNRRFRHMLTCYSVCLHPISNILLPLIRNGHCLFNLKWDSGKILFWKN